MIIPLKLPENNYYNNTYNLSIEIDETNIPILDIADRFGPTDYIDFIQWNEVTSSVMCGIDRYSRKFFVVKFIVNGTMKFMQTFFQRYTNCNYNWQACGHATPTLFDTCGIGVNDDQWRLIKDVIEGKQIKIKKEHRFAPDFYLEHNKNYTIQLYDEKKEKATNTIQKYWRLCRYNPEYKMCEKVQTNNLNEIMVEYGY
jgi:hypothetical protein